MKKASCLKPQCNAKSLDIWYVVLPSRSLTKFVHIMPLGPKMASPSGTRVLHRLIDGKHEQIFLSETTRHRALIFGMYYHLMYIYQVCSNYVPGAQNGSTRGSHVLDRLI